MRGVHFGIETYFKHCDNRRLQIYSKIILSQIKYFFLSLQNHIYYVLSPQENNAG